MFGGKFNAPADSTQSAIKKNLSRFGLLDMPDLDSDTPGDTDGDDDLEAELLTLVKGATQKSKKKPPPIMNPNELDEMIKASLKDIPSDEDISSDEDDPNILAELERLNADPSNAAGEKELNSVDSFCASVLRPLLFERLKMYETAEQNARTAKEIAKVKRMNRGISTLKTLIRQVDAGSQIDEEDIPPVVSISVPKPACSVTMPKESRVHTSPKIVLAPEQMTDVAPPVPPRAVKHLVPVSMDDTNQADSKLKSQCEEIPVTSNSSGEASLLEILQKRQAEYKKAALEAKRADDKISALNFVKIIKQFDVMMQSVNEGSTVDISSIPPSPSKINVTRVQTSPQIVKSDDQVQQSGSTDSTPKISTALTAPKTVLEALEQRLQRFQESQEAAEKEGNARKVRQQGRIVKQYQDAIRLHKSGKPIPADELPTPPGFAPIPGYKPPNSPGAPATPAAASATGSQTLKSIVQSVPARVPQNRSAGAQTRNEQQLQTILERQKQFKVVALKAKQNGDIEKAKEYLKLAKGFDALIETSKCGLPVDLSTIPVLPNDKKSLDSVYEPVRLNDCIEGNDLNVYQKLLIDLQQQLEMCIKTRDHFKAMGDIANANRFEQLAVQTKKDLTFVQLAVNSNLRVPKFHYETKPFTIVQCNVDLMDNDIEVSIVQGINYNVPNPKEVDTYVKITFPYPTETPQQFKTTVIYNTNNPTYDAITTFNIQRNVRACKRIFLRNTLKCEVWSKGGFLRSDTLIGTVNVKLQPLETQCTIHDAYDLMDGRRTVGGKLEVKIRLRDPITRKQVEQVEEKWLIIDS